MNIIRLDYRAEKISVNELVKKIKTGNWVFDESDKDFHVDCRVIYDIFCNIPIGNVFIVQKGTENKILSFKGGEIIVNTIYSYYKGQFKINGKYYKELEKEEKANFEQYNLNIYIIQNSVWKNFLKHLNGE